MLFFKAQSKYETVTFLTGKKVRTMTAVTIDFRKINCDTGLKD